MKLYKACAWLAVALAVTGEASADWLGRYIPPDSTEASLKNTAAALDKVTVSDVTLGSGSVVRDPFFGIEGQIEASLSGTYIRYNSKYVASSTTYTGDFSTTASSAFSLNINKTKANDPKVQVDKFAFSVTSYAMQADNVGNPWPETRAFASIEASTLSYELHITLSDALGQQLGKTIVLTSYTTTPYTPKERAFTGVGAQERISFDVAAALKDMEYTNAKFDLMMKADGNASTADANESLFISDIVLEGTAPEPASLLLALMGTVPMVLRRRR